MLITGPSFTFSSAGPLKIHRCENGDICIQAEDAMLTVEPQTLHAVIIPPSTFARRIAVERRELC